MVSLKGIIQVATTDLLCGDVHILVLEPLAGVGLVDGGGLAPRVLDGGRVQHPPRQGRHLEEWAGARTWCKQHKKKHKCKKVLMHKFSVIKSSNGHKFVKTKRVLIRKRIGRLT